MDGRLQDLLRRFRAGERALAAGLLRALHRVGELRGASLFWEERGALPGTVVLHEERLQRWHGWARILLCLHCGDPNHFGPVQWDRVGADPSCYRCDACGASDAFVYPDPDLEWWTLEEGDVACGGAPFSLDDLVERVAPLLVDVSPRSHVEQEIREALQERVRRKQIRDLKRRRSKLKRSVRSAERALERAHEELAQETEPAGPTFPDGMARLRRLQQHVDVKTEVLERRRALLADVQRELEEAEA